MTTTSNLVERAVDRAGPAILLILGLAAAAGVVTF